MNILITGRVMWGMHLCVDVHGFVPYDSPCSFGYKVIETNMSSRKAQMSHLEDTLTACKILRIEIKCLNTVKFLVLPHIFVSFCTPASLCVLLKTTSLVFQSKWFSRALGFISLSLKDWPNWGWNLLASIPNSPLKKKLIGLFF